MFVGVALTDVLAPAVLRATPGGLTLNRFFPGHLTLKNPFLHATVNSTWTLNYNKGANSYDMPYFLKSFI